MIQAGLPFSEFRNEGVFTDHYLRSVLPEDRDEWVAWNGALREEMRIARETILALCDAEANRLPGYSEAQLEENFIRPVLQALGHVWEVQPKAGGHKPDYGFFPSEQARDRARPADGSPNFWGRALAVGDAKSWQTKLDRPVSTRQGWDFGNPSYQITYYLYETGCKWGLLTNGRYWRLYPAEPKPNMQVFYEVDLLAALDSDTRDGFAYFWQFFRVGAFVPDAHERSFLERVRADAEQAAEKLREDIREQVYEALRWACRGFMEHGRNKLTDADLGQVHDNALVLLYRLLFVQYAEHSGLLPLRNGSSYGQEYSLKSIIGSLPNSLLSLDRKSTGRWQRVRDLFAVIDEGNEDLDVPAYDGGLFDDDRYPFLARCVMSDRHIAHVISLLTKTEKRLSLDYRELGVRQLGSIYEGLLEYRLARATEPMALMREKGRERFVPAADRGELGTDPAAPGPGDLYLATDKGERKTTGSYYTPQFIVDYIIENALGPVVAACKTPEDILSLRVLDPAMGSGHFLVSATDYLAHKLAERNYLPDAPPESEDEAQIARLRRLVVERCIHGVDINPLAVELARLSLWLSTVAEGQPLSFLDHHLRCGNSLIGAHLRDLSDPPQAIRSLGKAADRDEAAGTLALLDRSHLHQHIGGLVHGFGEIAQMLSSSREAVHRKAQILAELESAHGQRYREIGDLWCSRFFGNEYDGSRYASLSACLQRGEEPVSPEERAALARSRELAAQYAFLHWELAFPEAFFDEHGRPRSSPGFDAVIGNPPWERIKLQENEFFALRDNQISLAPTAAKRREVIARLPETNPQLWAAYEQAKQEADLQLAWTRDSDQYPFMGKGDTNLYAVMTERARGLLNLHGRLGFVVPSGIATDNTTSAFFGDLVRTKSLQTLLDFENREGLFGDVHRSFKYSIMVTTGGEPQEEVLCGFYLRKPEDLLDADRIFALRAEDFALVNPNTATCPVFRTRRDADLTRAIYSRIPVLVRETEDGEANPWGIRYMRMFDMTNDSYLFRTAVELEADGFWRSEGNAWRKGAVAYLPLYEGKMVQMYDHRAASVVVNSANIHRPASPAATTDKQHADSGYSVRPQFWVDGAEVAGRLNGASAPWLLTFDDVTAPTNSRTMIAAAIPRAAVGNTLPVLMNDTQSGGTLGLLLANLCCYALDYVARQKVGGQHLNFFVVKQLPVLPPSRYEDDLGGVRLADFVSQRVLELTYTAHDIAGFAEDMGYVDEEGKVRPPFAWDEERRLHLRCQLDALYFGLYGLTREEADYVMETFPIIKRHDEQRHGRYRTKELILHYYSAYAAGDVGAWVKG